MFNPEGEVTYYVPEGVWTGLLDGKKWVGSRWISETYDNLYLPLFVRENSVILIGKESGKPNYDYAKGLAVAVVGHLEEGSTTTSSAEVSDDKVGATVLKVPLIKSKDWTVSTEGEVILSGLEVKQLGCDGFHPLEWRNVGFIMS
jgi:alpha-D-xyloside xylohydrolase